ncbi:OmpA family protein [Bacteroidota bacterium]
MNSTKLGVSIFAILISVGVSAQESVKIKKKQFKKADQTEGFKEAWDNLSKGNAYYSEGFGTLNLAKDHYLFAYSYNGDNPQLNYKIGICYLYSDEKYKALDYFLKAYELEPEISTEIKLNIGKAYHYAHKFEEAKDFYLQYKMDIPPDDDLLEKTNEVEKLIVECTNGIEFSANPKRVIIDNLGEEVNSSFDDYNPRFAYEDSALIYTSRRPVSKRSKRNPLDNKFYEDIYISSYNGNDFSNARLMGKPFNSKGNDAIVGVAPDGESVFVYVGEEDGGDIQQVFFRADKEKWKKPKSLSKYIGSKAGETTAALTPNGEELYFVSANPDQSKGGKDIFVTKKNRKGKWEDPTNLGSLINSKFDEEGVYLSPDGNTMYFASKGHNSMGGFDIYKCTRSSADASWGTPVNLGYPINTPENEVFYVVDASGRYAYYSTIRDGGLGGMDIFKIMELGSEKEVMTLITEDLVAGFDSESVNPFLTLPLKRELDTTIMLTGRVLDTISGEEKVIIAALSFMDPETGQIVSRAMTGTDGRFRTRITEPKAYGVEITATDYLYYLDIVDLSELSPMESAEHDFYLQKIEVGSKVVLDNIYFETGKSILTPNSFEALKQVAKFLTDNSSVHLEISGHTDNTGSQRVNMNLSTARAKSVVDYLVEQGVSGARLVHKGYADTEPVASNDTPEGREQNRRVEFKVLSK